MTTGENRNTIMDRKIHGKKVIDASFTLISFFSFPLWKINDLWCIVN